MTATTGTIRSIYTTTTGEERALVAVRTHQGVRDVIVDIPAGAYLPRAEIDLNHGHDDVYTLILSEETPQGGRLTVAASMDVARPDASPEEVRAMVTGLIAAFGGCETRVYETDDAGARWLVGSNVKTDQAALKENGGRMAAGAASWRPGRS